MCTYIVSGDQFAVCIKFCSAVDNAHCGKSLVVHTPALNVDHTAVPVILCIQHWLVP